MWFDPHALLSRPAPPANLANLRIPRGQDATQGSEISKLAELAAPDRWAWPHSSAMNGQELDTFMARQDLFQQRGTSPQDAERLADKLVIRDRGGDDRRLCLECRHLRGDGPYRCGNARAAGLHPDLAQDMVLTLQHCQGHDAARLPMGVIVDAAPVVYAALEGEAGFKLRAQAW
ncbi:hypothetical protein IP95_02027 [Extensimonas vulgaris]|uniref:Uncharacterized protein n=3 Tax=Extensimonas vulgaris TaxID=1031594 RepID=A0A369AJD3_9BURK|nr:hypothetical protein DFR45_10977 [Extensimonas vulgaris]TWI37471.1 hypothetical protein IP95_02027 [Extensimonas vulgaris]